MNKLVKKTKCIRGISSLVSDVKNTYERIVLLVGDTESVRGRPYTIQLYDGKEVFFKYTNTDNILKDFVKYVDKKCKVNFKNIIYFHNLEFDIMMLFKKYTKEIYEQGTTAFLSVYGYDFEIFMGSVSFITMRSKKNENKIIHILDAMRFTMLGLENSAEAFGLKYHKLKTPEGLGERELKTKEFEEYAKQDVIVLYEIAKKILEFHKMFSLSPTVSIAQFSMSVFRKNYLSKGQVIQFPPKECVELAERSYHGGKNFYKYLKPKFFENATEVDINSSYPYACLFLPSLLRGKGRFLKTDEVDLSGNTVGVYEIDGYIKNDIPLIYDDSFNPVFGEFSNIAVTTWDIISAVEHADKFEYKVKRGWIFVDYSDYNPFKQFIMDIYEKRKLNQNNPDLKIIYKYILNSFYGKFIQANLIEDYAWSPTDIMDEETKKIIDEYMKKHKVKIDYRFDSAVNKFVLLEKEYEAGIQYNPFLATMITSYARYYLSKLEKILNGFHSATDSVKTTIKVPDNMLSDNLGGLKKVVEGKCYVFRNKLYLHYAKDFNNCKHKPDQIPDWMWDGDQHLCKFALHGYHGDLQTLVKHRVQLLHSSEMDYTYTKVVKLREGVKQGLETGDFIVRNDKLRL